MKKQKPKDPQLDAPSVANEDKHINFPEQEEKAMTVDPETPGHSQEDEQRRRQWNRGIEEGKRSADDEHC